MTNDFDASIFITAQDGQTILAAEYDSVLDGDGMFVTITNDMLDDEYGDNCTIHLYRDFKQQMYDIQKDYGSLERGVYSVQFQIFKDDIQNVSLTANKYNSIANDRKRTDSIGKRYLNGFRQTHDIIANADAEMRAYNEINGWTGSKKDFIPGVMGAFNTTVTHDGKRCNGYLPAIGQLVHMQKNLMEINKALTKILTGMNKDHKSDGMDSIERKLLPECVTQRDRNSDEVGIKGAYMSCNISYDYNHDAECMLWYLSEGIAQRYAADDGLWTNVIPLFML